MLCISLRCPTTADATLATGGGGADGVLPLVVAGLDDDVDVDATC